MDWIIVFLEIIFEGICEGWFYLMQKCVPDKMENKKFRFVLKIVVGVFSIVLLVCVLVGISFWLSNDEHSRSLGMYMVFIPLAISGLQIAGGVAFHIKNKKK